MSRRLPAALLLTLLSLSAGLGLVGATASAQTPAPGQSATDTPTGETSAATATPEPSDATDVPVPAEEVPSVTGAANPVDAPLLGSGTVVDTILQSETLWYAVDAAPGQRVGATVLVVGRPDGPEADDTVLEVTVTDPQRQPLDVAETAFTGQADGIVELPTAEIPAIGGDQPLLSVSLHARAGAQSLQGTGYRLQLTVVIDGVAMAPAETAPPVTQMPAEPQPEVTVTSAPAPPPGPPNVVGDLLPFALISLAVGGFAGFELSRRGL